MKRIPYQDLADLPEDERIKQIVQHLTDSPPGTRVGVIVDDEPGKAERYRQKIRADCPGVTFTTGPGPVPKTTLIRVTWLRRHERGLSV